MFLQVFRLVKFYGYISMLFVMLMGEFSKVGVVGVA